MCWQKEKGKGGVLALSRNTNMFMAPTSEMVESSGLEERGNVYSTCNAELYQILGAHGRHWGLTV